MSIRLFFYVTLILVHTTLAIDYKPLIGAVHEYNYCNEQPRSRITYLEDTHGKKYVVKQYRYEKWPSLLATSICELVALDMGHALKVPLNEACMIPAGIAFLGKETDILASLHRLVPGVPFSDYREVTSGPYKELDLKQKDAHGSPQGLSRELIYNMSLHNDFPAMVALDTYASNMGRLWHNFFYDEATDKFYGIDMASSFFKDLCGPSFSNVSQMLTSTTVTFSEAEGQALVKYYKSLKKLIKWYPAAELCKQIEAYARKAGFNSDFLSKEIRAYCIQNLEKRKRTINKSCANAQKLKKALKNLLVKHALM